MVCFVLLHVFKTCTYFHWEKEVRCMLKLFLLKQKWNRTILFYNRRCVNWIHWKPRNQVTLALTSYHVSAEHLCELLAHGICAVIWLNPLSLWTKLNHIPLHMLQLERSRSSAAQPMCSNGCVCDYLVTCVQVSLAGGGIWWQLLQLMGFSFLCVQFAWKGPIVGSIEYCAQLWTFPWGSGHKS